MIRQASPQHHGDVARLRVPFLYPFLPRFLQRLVSKLWFLSFLAPKWERRYLILLGSFLYKFIDSSSSNPKGTPLPVESVDIHIVSSPDADDDVSGIAEAFWMLPPEQRNCVFVVSTLRKKYYYAASSRDDALAWVNSVQQARQEAITRGMGHAPDGSYPRSWESYDILGRRLVSSKDRVRAKVEEHVSREMEMSTFSEGGPLPRGYYG